MTSAKSWQAEREEKRLFWEKHINGWQSTHLTQVEYCRQYNLSVHRFTSWKKKFQTPEPSRTLIELNLSPALYPKIPSPVSPLWVSVSRFQVAVERNFDPETLRQLIYSLERL